MFIISGISKPALQNWSFDDFNKVFEKICEGACFLVRLQTVGYNLIKSEFLRSFF